MMATAQFLPGTGRWQPEGMTEGLRHPSTMLRMAPLPVPGRNCV